MGRPVGPRFRQMVRKNSGLLIFAPESRLQFVQIKSVRFTGKRPRRPQWYQTDGLEEMEREFPIGIFLPEKTGLPLQMFRCSRKFSPGTTQKRHVPFTFQPDFPETFVNGKHATIAYLGTSPYAGRRIYLAFLFYLAYFHQTTF